MTRLRRARIVMGMSVEALAKYLDIDLEECKAMESGEIPLTREAESVVHDSACCEQGFPEDCLESYIEENIE